MNVGGGGGNCLGCLDVYALTSEERASKDLSVSSGDLPVILEKSKH